MEDEREMEREYCIYAADEGVSCNKFKLTIPTNQSNNQLVPLFPSSSLSSLAFTHTLPHLFTFFLRFIFSSGETTHISVASALLPTILACSPHTTYHVYSADSLAMSQKPNAIIFGWSSTISLSLVTTPSSLPCLRRRFSPSLRWSQHLFSCTGRFSRASGGRDPSLGRCPISISCPYAVISLYIIEFANRR